MLSRKLSDIPEESERSSSAVPSSSASLTGSSEVESDFQQGVGTENVPVDIPENSVIDHGSLNRDSPIGCGRKIRTRSLGRFFRKSFCSNFRWSWRSSCCSCTSTRASLNGSQSAIITAPVEPPEVSNGNYVCSLVSNSPKESRCENPVSEPSGGQREDVESLTERRFSNQTLDLELQGANAFPSDLNRSSFIGTGAVPKIRIRSVPAELEECRSCSVTCQMDKIVLDKTWVMHTDKRERTTYVNTDLVRTSPRPCIDITPCPLCCGKCIAKAAGIFVCDITKSCCCRFEDAKCSLLYEVAPEVTRRPVKSIPSQIDEARMKLTRSSIVPPNVSFIPDHSPDKYSEALRRQHVVQSNLPGSTLRRHPTITLIPGPELPTCGEINIFSGHGKGAVSKNPGKIEKDLRSNVTDEISEDCTSSPGNIPRIIKLVPTTPECIDEDSE